MKQLDFTQRVENPKEWASNIIPKRKPEGRVRIFLDLSHLNELLKRYNILISYHIKSLPLRNKEVEYHELYTWQYVTKFGHGVMNIFGARFPNKEKRAR